MRLAVTRWTVERPRPRRRENEARAGNIDPLRRRPNAGLGGRRHRPWFEPCDARRNPAGTTRGGCPPSPALAGRLRRKGRGVREFVELLCGGRGRVRLG